MQEITNLIPELGRFPGEGNDGQRVGGLQVLKYLVRAGKKDGESYDKDYKKALDYAKELANLSNENELTEYTTDDIMGFIQELADDFERWEGIK